MPVTIARARGCHKRPRRAGAALDARGAGSLLFMAMGAVRILAAALALAVCLPAAARAGAEGELDDLLASRALRGARVGIAVVDLESGETLLARQADRPMVPASNQKLLIAAGALLHWGPTHRFETRVLAETAPDAQGVVEGPLWIVGSGDPSLVSERLWKLAEELYVLGLREVRGGLAIDASYFDAHRTHPDWEPLSDRAYHARTSAFAANYSSFRVDVASGRRAGAPALVAVAPNIDYFRVRSKAPTIARGGTPRLDLELLPDGSGELVRVSGAVRLGAKTKTYWRSVQLPERYAAAVLRAQLHALGIRVRGSDRFEPAPDGAVELLSYPGETIGEIVRKLNKFSNNFIAEQLLKSLGAEWSGGPGSWQAGTRALSDLLHARGLIDRGTIIADASGLSPRNRLSPASLVRVIRELSGDFDTGPEFLASLPLGGLDGTLEDRMVDGAVAVRGKTGHLRHVASLSGLLSASNGRRLVFSVLVNGGRGGPEAMDDAIDSFVAGLADASFAPAPAADVEPSNRRATSESLTARQGAQSAPIGR